MKIGLNHLFIQNYILCAVVIDRKNSIHERDWHALELVLNLVCKVWVKKVELHTYLSYYSVFMQQQFWIL